MQFKCFIFVFLVVVKGIFCRRDTRQQKHSLEPSTTEYLTKQSHNININIKIHIDSVLSQNYTALYGRESRSKLKLLAEKLIHDVERIYRDLKVDHRNVKFILLQTKFLKNHTVEMSANGTAYLRKYCDWQATKKKTWYYSVLLTGLDLFYDVGGKIVRKSRGRSYLNGMCHVRYSCTVLEFHPDVISFLLAHELAHSLGISHDGPPNNNCKSKGYMMGAKFKTRKHPKKWSECSRSDLRKYLLSKKSKCLQPSTADME